MGRHALFGQPCAYRAYGSLNPTLYQRLVGKVRRSKARFQTRLILEHAALKPHSVKSQERRCQPWREARRQHCHENQMSEIYGVARVSVSAFDHDAFRRDVEARAAAIRHAVSSDESVLQAAPNKQECTRRMDDEYAPDANPVQMR